MAARSPATIPTVETIRAEIEIVLRYSRERVHLANSTGSGGKSVWHSNTAQDMDESRKTSKNISVMITAASLSRCIMAQPPVRIEYSCRQASLNPKLNKRSSSRSGARRENREAV